MNDAEYYSLLPLVVLIAISLASRVGAPWQWQKLMLLQPVLALLAMIAGIMMRNATLAQFLGWSAFLLLHVPPWYIFRQTRRAMTAMDAAAIERWGRYLPLVFWGLPGRFWKAMVDAYVEYFKGDAQAADALLAPWRNCSDLPGNLKDVPIQYALIGKSICWNWQGVIDDFETLRYGRHKPAANVYFTGARAYAELGQFNKAGESLRQSRFDESINPLDSLALALLSFFALCGAISETRQLLSILKSTRSALPEALSLYWVARCYLARGDRENALQNFDQALTLSTVPLLSKRIEYARQQAAAPLPNISERPDVQAEVHDIWAHFQRGAFIQEILSPRRSSPLVNAILFLNLAVFALVNLDIAASFLGNLMQLSGAPTCSLANWVYQSGVLNDLVIKKGEYWRLITYLFLHAGILHISLNMLGLHAFGRIAENIFGSTRFLAIYFVGGILSGVSHLLLSPGIAAVGASGAILAIYGAVGVGIYKLKRVLPGPLRKRYLAMMIGFAAAQLVLDHFVPKIAAFAHMGGLIAGIALGFVTSTRTPSKEAIDGTQAFVGG